MFRSYLYLFLASLISGCGLTDFGEEVPVYSEYPVVVTPDDPRLESRRKTRDRVLPSLDYGRAEIDDILGNWGVTFPREKSPYIGSGDEDDLVTWMRSFVNAHPALYDGIDGEHLKVIAKNDDPRFFPYYRFLPEGTTGLTKLFFGPYDGPPTRLYSNWIEFGFNVESDGRWRLVSTSNCLIPEFILRAIPNEPELQAEEIMEDVVGDTLVGMCWGMFEHVVEREEIEVQPPELQTYCSEGILEIRKVITTFIWPVGFMYRHEAVLGDMLFVRYDFICRNESVSRRADRNDL